MEEEMEKGKIFRKKVIRNVCGWKENFWGKSQKSQTENPIFL